MQLTADRKEYLQGLTKTIRRHIVRMTHHPGSGHPGIYKKQSLR
ncbi:transketolase N-terminal domain/subunit [Neobacillus niacini]|nr:transketolase N-terminal domain/subunit [Neobacillus niacini]